MDTLQKLKDKPLFDVPDHYFEQLQHDVMQRVKKEERRQHTQRRWISAVSIAASFTIICVLSYFIFINRNTNEHFYVHEDIVPHEETVLALDSNYLAEATELITDKVEYKEPSVSKKSMADNSNNTPAETIVYNAVEYYVDDYEIDSFCEMMMDLDCYYDY